MGEEGEEELRMRLVLGLCHRNQTDLSFRMPVLSLVTAFTKKKIPKTVDSRALHFHTNPQ